MRPLRRTRLTKKVPHSDVSLQGHQHGACLQVELLHMLPFSQSAARRPARSTWFPLPSTGTHSQPCLVSRSLAGILSSRPPARSAALSPVIHAQNEVGGLHQHSSLATRLVLTIELFHERRQEGQQAGLLQVVVQEPGVHRIGWWLFAECWSCHPCILFHYCPLAEALRFNCKTKDLSRSRLLNASLSL